MLYNYVLKTKRQTRKMDYKLFENYIGSLFRYKVKFCDNQMKITILRSDKTFGGKSCRSYRIYTA